MKVQKPETYSMPNTFDWWVQGRCQGWLSKANVLAAAGRVMAARVEAVAVRYRNGLERRQDWSDLACQRLLTAPTPSSKAVKR